MTWQGRDVRARPEAPADVAIVGAGAAGMMAAIWAGRTARARGVRLRVVLVDGARSLGAKILVAGGGRCNVTHHAVDETAFAGSTRPAIRKVLRHWSVEETVRFFAELGVTLKREETGKLFPTTDRARTVLDALVGAVRDAGVELRHPWRVGSVELAVRAEGVDDGAGVDDVGGAADVHDVSGVDDAGGPVDTDPGPGGAVAAAHRPRFRVRAVDGDVILARRVVLATGGLSLPKTGSDGAGHAIARSLGHSITARVFSALVPLLLPPGHPLRSLSGLAARATVEVRSGAGRKLASFTDPVLCTHFGLSGPAILDVSRWWTAAREEDAAAVLTVNWIPGESAETLVSRLVQAPGESAAAFLRGRVPARLAEALCELAGVDGATSLRQLTRQERRRLAEATCALRVPVVGDRGFAHAEVTAGGVPLRETHLTTLESRLCPGLHLCGEILDVDGRIGGFNFQWAWASGVTVGRAVAAVTTVGSE